MIFKILTTQNKSVNLLVYRLLIDNQDLFLGKGTINKSGVSYVRTTLYLAAMNAVRYNSVCNELYTRLRAKGKPFNVAIVAAINKLIKQFFAVVKNSAVLIII